MTTIETGRARNECATDYAVKIKGLTAAVWFALIKCAAIYLGTLSGSNFVPVLVPEADGVSLPDPQRVVAALAVSVVVASMSLTRSEYPSSWVCGTHSGSASHSDSGSSSQ